MFSFIKNLFHNKRSFKLSERAIAEGADWLSPTASSGFFVNFESALNYPPVWRAVNLIARDVAKLPLEIFERKGENNKTPALSHPGYKMLRRKPSEDMSAYQFKMTLTARALLLGNGYAWIRRMGNGAPGELIPLPIFTRPKRDQDGNLFYESNMENGTVQTFRKEDVFHIRGLGDGIEGRSVIGHAQEAIATGLSHQQFTGEFFSKGVKPSAFFEHPMKLDDESYANLKKSLEQQHQGLGKFHNVMILEEGMKANPWSMPNTDAQFIEQRKFSLIEIANVFGIPSNYLGDETRTSFASLEEESQKYLDNGLDPWLLTWEEEAWMKLLTPVQQQANSHAVEFNRKAIVRTNMKERGAFYNLGIMGGWLNADEVRGAENLNPVPGGAGQTFRVQMNTEPSQGKEGSTGPAVGGQDEDEGSPPPPPARAFSPAQFALLENACRRIVREVSARARKRAKSQDPCDWKEYLNSGLEADTRRGLRDATWPACEVLGLNVDEVLDTVFHRVTGILWEYGSDLKYVAEVHKELAAQLMSGDSHD